MLENSLLTGKRLLTPLQKSFLALFAGLPDQKQFYLTGGTALSEYYFGHRLSFDLDFFTGVDGLVLPAVVAEHLGIQALVSELYFPEMMLPGGGQVIGHRLIVIGALQRRVVIEVIIRMQRNHHVLVPAGGSGDGRHAAPGHDHRVTAVFQSAFEDFIPADHPAAIFC